MNGDAGYSLEEFLLDLLSEVKSSFSKDDLNSNSGEMRNSEFNKTVNEVFRFVSEICFQAAINSPDLQRVLKRTASDDTEIIRKTLKTHKHSITLLRALFLKQVSARLENGLTKSQAAKQVITQNKGILVDFLGKSAREYSK